MYVDHPIAQAIHAQKLVPASSMRFRLLTFRISWLLRALEGIVGLHEDLQNLPTCKYVRKNLQWPSPTRCSMAKHVGI